MDMEQCCGAVVFTRDDGTIKYLIERNLKGMYGFPKGHVEPGETERETAVREIYEETGLHVNFLEGFRAEDVRKVPDKPGVLKHIVYFAAEYTGQEYKFQKEELTGAQLMTYEEAMASIQFENSRKILKQAHEFITVRLKIGGDKK